MRKPVPKFARPVDAVRLLKADHREVSALFRQFKASKEAEEKGRLVRQICTALIVHITVEEELLYPACREGKVDNAMLEEAQVEHDGAKLLIAGLMHHEPDSLFYEARIAVLKKHIRRHMREEERVFTGLFAWAKASGIDMNLLGRRILERREELLSQARSRGLDALVPRSLDVDLLSALMEPNSPRGHLTS